MKIRQLFVGLIVFAMLMSFSSAVLADFEPNDTFATAETVSDGDIVSGDLDDTSDSSDYYQIYLTSGDVILVTMTSGDFDIDLYDTSEYWLDSDSWDDNYNPYIKYTVSSSGYYYIEISTWYYTGTYTVEFDVNPEVFPGATEVYDGDAVSGTLDYGTSSEDYYKISLNSGDTLYVLEIAGSFDFNLYDSTGTFLEDDYVYTGGLYLIEYTATSSGLYYIEIQTWYSTGDYTLKFGVNNMPSTSGPTGGEPYVGGDAYVEGEPKAEVPTWDVGDGWWFGNVIDADQFQSDIDQALTKLEAAGFNADMGLSGGAGVYFGVEVVSTATDHNGYNCYDVSVNGAVGIDIGLDMAIDGSISESGYNVDVDISGNGFVTGEAVLTGDMYFTTDGMALAGISLTLTADANGELSLDGSVNALGQNVNIDLEASMDITDASLEFIMDFEPPLDLFQFPFWEGKEWYVPAWDTDVSGELNAAGTVTYSAVGNVMGEPINEGQTVNLANEIGDNDYFKTIEGGEPDTDYWGSSLGGGTLLTCDYANGNIFVIETDLGNAFGFIDTSDFGFPGTRQLGGLDPTELMPEINAGMQFDSSQGFLTGATMNGEVMTDPVTKEEVLNFAADPQGEVTKETGGASSGGGGLMGIILLLVIVVVIVVVLVVIMKKRGGKPQQEFGQQDPYAQQQYQQGQYYQQPPPPQQYPQDQYQQPPPPPPQQGQY